MASKVTPEMVRQVREIADARIGIRGLTFTLDNGKRVEIDTTWLPMDWSDEEIADAVNRNLRYDDYRD